VNGVRADAASRRVAARRTEEAKKNAAARLPVHEQETQADFCFAKVKSYSFFDAPIRSLNAVAAERRRQNLPVRLGRYGERLRR